MLARAGNVAHPDDPGFEDFGEIVLAHGRASGYIRVDWFTPDGLPTWGDGRLFDHRHDRLDRVAQVRRHRRPARQGPSVPRRRQGARHIDCSDAKLPYYENLRRDIVERTQTAMTHAHCYKVCELALKAQAARVAGRRAAPDRRIASVGVRVDERCAGDRARVLRRNVSVSRHATIGRAR